MRVASVRASAGRAAASAGRREFHVAPMRDYTDRHHRRFTRLLSREAKLWSEMEKPHAILKAADASGNKLDRLLSRGSDEGYEVFQIGGNDPVTVAQATRLVLPYGYDELNLNCGCPAIESGGGDYGAALMRDGGDDAAFVIESIVREVENANHFALYKYGSKGTKPKVSVKCRVGIAETLGDVVPKDASAEEVLEKIAAPLERFIKKCADAGAASVVVHCRQAVMSGMSPSKNRGVPPLRPEILFDLVARGEMHVNVNDFSDRPSVVDATRSLDFVLNGGVSSFADVAEAFAKCPTLKGAQAGRWPLLRPFDMLHVDAFLRSLDDALKVSFGKEKALDGVPFDRTRRRRFRSERPFDRDASARAVAAAEAYAFRRAAAYEHQSRRNGNEKGAAARPLALALADLDDRLERSTGNDESESEASSFSSFETDDDDDPDALANAVDGLLSVCGGVLEVEGGTNRAKRTRKALAKAVGKKVGGKQRGTRAEAAAAEEAGRVAS